ncbi:uncharacterized protein LOC119560148 [Drosophila subpulchrella]|uniref:uncharacterized protein LOC119560148 n=1 Tax=Drosophila subpulchrella TaxID=1486046 RepID=UPI0018A12994|nr:uncharacterized protein LOC119560148 [Drosophila subpulchrella]
MPKKVITRRQRKAAESKRKAEEEAHQKGPGSLQTGGVNKCDEPGIGGDKPTDAIPTVQTRDLMVSKRAEEMPKVFLGRNKKDGKPKLPTSNQAGDKLQNTDQPCDALQKIRKSSHRKSFLSEVKKSALNLEQVFTTSTTWYDQNNKSLSQESMIASKATDTINIRTAANSVFPLVSKFCKQIKSHLHTVLPKRNGLVSSPQHLKEKGAQRTPDFQLKVNELMSLKTEPLLGSGINIQTDQNREGESWTPAALPMVPSSETNPSSGYEAPLKVLGNTGYFILTGTNARQALQLTELARKNVDVQSYLQLPSEMMDQVEQQIAELDRNREQILEKMRNKHTILAQPRASREKKQHKTHKQI